MQTVFIQKSSAFPCKLTSPSCVDILIAIARAAAPVTARATFRSIGINDHLPVISPRNWLPG